jgi:hypothetical protein
MGRFQSAVYPFIPLWNQTITTNGPVRCVQSLAAVLATSALHLIRIEARRPQISYSGKCTATCPVTRDASWTIFFRLPALIIVQDQPQHYCKVSALFLRPLRTPVAALFYILSTFRETDASRWGPRPRRWSRLRSGTSLSHQAIWTGDQRLWTRQQRGMWSFIFIVQS